MEISQKMVKCYELLNDSSYDDCLEKAKQQLECTIELSEIKNIIKNKSILEDVTIDNTDNHEITIKDLFDEFQRTVHFKSKQTLNNLVYGIIENLVGLKEEKEKETMVSDIIILIQQLSSDTEYFNKQLKIAKVPYYNTIGCKNPFPRYYYIRLSIVLKLYLKKIYERYSFHISDNVKAYIKTPPSLQAFFQLYSITEWEKTIGAQEDDKSDLPSLTWKGSDAELTELTIALISADLIKFDRGKNNDGDIGAAFTNTFLPKNKITPQKYYLNIGDVKARTGDKKIVIPALDAAFDKYMKEGRKKSKKLDT